VAYFACYVVTGNDKPLDGDHVASGTGWASWGAWAVGLGKSFPATVRLADQGEGYPPDLLEAELKRLIASKPGRPDEDVRHITEELLTVVADRPKGCIAVIVTDGSDNEDDEE